MAGLLPDNVKSDLLIIKNELNLQLNLCKESTDNTRDAMTKFAVGLGSTKIDPNEWGRITRRIRYKNIEFELVLYKNELYIDNRVDVYFITKNSKDARNYMNKSGKYSLISHHNDEYAICCRYYNWSRIK